ncbi:MAG: hypothetical protein U9R43_16530 [Thermodesulfobacteriota bacterium]|nr:hypothetical protein [Thermodesulfobacteriota bacterium]
MQIAKCYSCSKIIGKREKYCLHMELFACGDVHIDEDDLSKDNKQEIKKICEELKNADPEKLEEDVYVCYDLNLCKRCRDVFLQRIKCKEFL